MPQAQVRLVPAGVAGVGGDARGADGLFAAIDRLAGCPVPLSALESLVLPSRVRDYSPAQLDSPDVGRGRDLDGRGRAARRRWLGRLRTADAPELLPDALPLADSVSHPDLAAAVLGAVDVGGGWFHGQILANLSAAQLRVSPLTLWPTRCSSCSGRDGSATTLWNPSGAASADARRAPDRRPAATDLAADLAAGRRRGAAVPGRSGAAGCGQFPTAARASLLPGRWSAVPRGSLDPTVRAAAGAEWLLARHAVLTRGPVHGALPRGLHDGLQVLSQMEVHRRLHPRLRHRGAGRRPVHHGDGRRPASRPPAWGVRGSWHGPAAGCSRPGQPYGAALPGLRARGRGERSPPGAEGGASVVLVSGRPVAYLERGGRSLLTWTDDPAELASAAGPSPRPCARRLGAVSIQRVDGAGIADSAAGAALLQAGFVWTPAACGSVERLQIGAADLGNTRPR